MTTFTALEIIGFMIVAAWMYFIGCFDKCPEVRQRYVYVPMYVNCRCIMKYKPDVERARRIAQDETRKAWGASQDTTVRRWH